MYNPKISIITIVYNDKIGLEKTINSVLNQDFKDFEFIVIDGLSTDGSSDLANKYIEHITKYVREKDNGIADAFNKGLKFCNGDWVYFLNAGDFFAENNTLTKIYNSFLSLSKSSIVSGKVKIVDVNQVPLGYNHPNGKVSIDDLLNRNIIAHQATFVKLEVFNKIGNFKPYKIHMDYDFWIRCLRSEIKFELIEEVVACFTRNGVSSFRKNYLIAVKEQLGILLNYSFISKFRYYKVYYSNFLYFSLKSLIRLLIGEKMTNIINQNRLKR
ncbi:glycosyltransferase family 2 protein [Flavobacterium sp. Arc2]|jgi:glycosyltransferase involved in cell wall biosynthesis|uniref:glycosyltransferase family 2 protein n=1 Tax=Flavobacterium sp. Arc2 TaxID=3046685 RepID=UPI00352CF6D1